MTASNHNDPSLSRRGFLGATAVAASNRADAPQMIGADQWSGPTLRNSS